MRHESRRRWAEYLIKELELKIKVYRDLENVYLQNLTSPSWEPRCGYKGYTNKILEIREYRCELLSQLEHLHRDFGSLWGYRGELRDYA